MKKGFADYMKKVLNDTDLYYLSDEERNALQKCLLGMYQDIIHVCEKYNLCIMLGGGSILGAVRHQGFIPWDDDIDLIMPRDDYNIMLRIIDKELKEKYTIVSPEPKSAKNYFFLRIMKKNTIMRNFNDDSNDVSGVSIDIQPLEKVPDNYFCRIIFTFMIRTFQFIIRSVKKYKETNKLVRNIMNRTAKTKIMYILILFVGFIFSLFSLKNYYKFFDLLVSFPKGEKYVTIPTGRANYLGELLPKEIFFPVSKGKFENYEVNLPHNPDAYLRNLYGNNYMQIPPLEKRERHIYLEFNLNTAVTES